MRTGGQNFTSRRRRESRARAVLDRNWFQVGYMDAKLHHGSKAPFPADDPRLSEWQRGYEAAHAGARVVSNG